MKVGEGGVAEWEPNKSKTLLSSTNATTWGQSSAQALLAAVMTYPCSLRLPLQNDPQGYLVDRLALDLKHALPLHGPYLHQLVQLLVQVLGLVLLAVLLLSP